MRRWWCFEANGRYIGKGEFTEDEIREALKGFHFTIHANGLVETHCRRRRAARLPKLRHEPAGFRCEEVKP